MVELHEGSLQPIQCSMSPVPEMNPEFSCDSLDSSDGMCSIIWIALVEHQRFLLENDSDSKNGRVQSTSSSGMVQYS